MPEFIEAKHDGVEGTTLLPATAFKHLPGWRPVDEDVRVPAANDGTRDEVLARVGDDPDKAQAALDAELASTKPRTTLVDALTAITAPTTDEES